MKRKMKMEYFQQGDVLLFKEKLPLKRMEESVDPILQHGEHTGHKHALRFMHDSGHGFGRVVKESDLPVVSIPQFRVFINKETSIRYLKIDAPADLVHEEHKTIAIPPGEYRIGIVREYDHFKEEAREVID